MSADDLLFEPIKKEQTEDWKEEMWRQHLANLPPEVDVKKLLEKMEQHELDAIKAEFFRRLDAT